MELWHTTLSQRVRKDEMQDTQTHLNDVVGGGE